MLARAALLGLFLACSALRIQQKEQTQDAGACGSASSVDGVDQLNAVLTAADFVAGLGVLVEFQEEEKVLGPTIGASYQTMITEMSKCKCYLMGYGGTVASCTGEEMGILGLELSKHAGDCYSMYLPHGWYTISPDVDRTSVLKNSPLVQCLKMQISPGTTDATTAGFVASARAVLDPAGVVPAKILDPALRASQLSADTTTSLAMKSDYPGSTPFGVCMLASQLSSSVVAMCASGTSMFDGYGMCCSNIDKFRFVGTTMSNPPWLVPYHQSSFSLNEAKCLEIAQNAQEVCWDRSTGKTGLVHWTGYSMLLKTWVDAAGNEGPQYAPDYFPGIATADLGWAFKCFCNVKHSRCLKHAGTAPWATDGNNSPCEIADDCANGGLGSAIYRVVPICNSL